MLVKVAIVGRSVFDGRLACGGLWWWRWLCWWSVVVVVVNEVGDLMEKVD